MSWFARITRTNHDWAATVARLALGLVLFPHGAQKVLGWFGGYGISGTLGFFGSIGIPMAAGALVIAAEFLGSLGLITGLFGRVAAAGIIPVMVGAVLLTHLPNGFLMNWAGTQKGEGYEFHILVVALALVVIIKGSGALSLDGWLNRAHAVKAVEPARELAKAA